MSATDVQDAIEETDPENDPGSSSTPDTITETSANQDSFDADLAEFDKATSESETAQQIIDEADRVAHGNELEEILIEANRADAIASGRLDPRDETISEYQRAEHQRQETEAFIAYGREIVDKLPDTLPDRENFVENELIKEAATNQQTKLAFDLRNVDPQQARQEMAKLEFAWNKLQQSDHPQKDRIARALQERYLLAETAFNSKRILNKVQQQIVAKGRKWASQQIDPEATADRDAVAAAVRGANLGAPPEPPPPDFGSMSTKEFSDYKKRLFGSRGGSR